MNPRSPVVLSESHRKRSGRVATRAVAFTVPLVAIAAVALVAGGRDRRHRRPGAGLPAAGAGGPSPA